MEKWRETYKRNKAITEAVIASAAALDTRQAGDGQLQPLGMRSQRHVLKTWPEYFYAVQAGAKTFEYTGDEVIRNVTYILRGPAFGVEAGWCVMALASHTDQDQRSAPL